MLKVYFGFVYSMYVCTKKKPEGREEKKTVSRYVLSITDHTAFPRSLETRRW